MQRSAGERRAVVRITKDIFRSQVEYSGDCVHLSRMRSRFSIFTLGLVLIVGLGFFFFSSEARSEIAPAWSLDDLQGKPVKLSDFKGKIVVLNFWATWCPPCVAEIPDFIEIEKEYRGKGVAVVGVSIDSLQPSEVAVFVKKAGINYPIVMSTDEVTTKYGADDGVPITLIIRPDGTIADKHLGIVTKDYLEGHIQKLLSAGAH